MSFPRDKPFLVDIFKSDARGNPFERLDPIQETYRGNTRKTSSLGLPSIDSAYGDSDSLSPVSNSNSHEDEKSVSTSEFSFDDLDEFRSDAKLSSNKRADN